MELQFILNDNYYDFHYIIYDEQVRNEFAGFFSPKSTKNKRQTGQRTHATDHQVQKALDRDSRLVFNSPAESDRLLADTKKRIL